VEWLGEGWSGCLVEYSYVKEIKRRAGDDDC
jgi:hypothetical protein